MDNRKVKGGRMSKDYTQPFYVGRNNQNFRGVSADGYLPALELPETEPIIEHHIVYHHIHSNLSGKQAHSIENNTNQILALKKTLNTPIGKKKRGRYLD